MPWAENTYDRDVPVSTIYDLILAHADAADSSDDPEVLRRLERRVRAYHRLVDLDMCPFCSDDLATARRLKGYHWHCLLYTSPSPRDLSTSRMPSSA